MTRDEALKTVYPDANHIEHQMVFLSPEQRKKVEDKARSKLTSNLFTFYVAKRGDELLGYSIIDTHTVRTQTETVMITINPDGTVRRVDVLAFFEPLDYYPSEKWINLFKMARLTSSLWIGRGIPNMTGATLTSNAITNAVRRSLALFEEVCSEGICKGV